MLSLVVTVAVFGAIIFSVSASEDTTGDETEKTCTVFPRFRNRWQAVLTDTQQEDLQALREGFRAEVEALLADNGVERISELDEVARESLRQMVHEFKVEIKDQLESWNIEIPEFRGPMGLRDTLSDEQQEELRTMRENFRAEIESELAEWGVEVPDLQEGMGFRGMRPRGFARFRP